MHGCGGDRPTKLYMGGMTVSELQDHITGTLARRHGGTRRRWRMALGPIRLHDIATHPHCNWSAAPSGSFDENEAIERLLDDSRLRHPVVEKG